MTITVRLLSTYQGNSYNDIVRLPDAIANALIAGNNATLNLAGGNNVAPPALARVDKGPARLLYSAAGAFLGLGDSQGNLILNSSGATTPVGATVPGAPTSLALTAAAGAVIGAFTAPASTGGDPIQWYEMTLSNGTVVRGDASPIAAAAPAGAAVTAVVRAVNGVGASAASNTSNSVTPTGVAPSVPATAITLTGPTTVAQGVATSAYTVALSPNGGTVASPVTVTPTAVAGVTFAPTSLSLTTASPSGTFTATSSTSGTKSIAVTNNGGLTNPSAISLVVSADAVISSLNSTSVFGDSMMDHGNPLVQGTAPASGGETSMSYIGVLNDTMRKTGAGFDVVALRAVGGTTAQQHLASQLPAVIADTSRIAWYHGGVNSYNDGISSPLNGGNPYTQTENINTVKSIITQLAAAKDVVIIDSITPVSQAGTTGAKTRATEFVAHNLAIKNHCATFPNVIYNDQYAAVVDPASGPLNPLADLIQAVDGIHWTTTGARAVGEDAITTVAPKVNLTKYKTKGANLLPAFTGTGGTTSPGTGSITGAAAIPANWEVQVASGTASVAVSSTVAGTVRLTITNASTTAASTVQFVATNNAALLAAIASGDTIQGGYDFATIGTSSKLTRVAANIRINGNAGIIWTAMARDTGKEAAGVFKYNQAAQSGRRWTHPWVVPSAPSQVEFIMSFNLDPTAGSVVIDISLPELFKLT